MTSSRFARTTSCVLLVLLGGLLVGAPSDAKTIKRKSARPKTTQRRAVSAPKGSTVPSRATVTVAPVIGPAVAPPPNVEDIKTAVLAVFKRYTEIDLNVQSHPELGPGQYAEVAVGDALKEFTVNNKEYRDEGSYCDCTLAGLEVLDPRFESVTTTTASFRYCERGTGPIRLRKDNSILTKYPQISVSDRGLEFTLDKGTGKWFITDAYHTEPNGRNSTCADGK